MNPESSSQRDEAYRQLRPMLLHGQIRPGSRLRETQWAEQLGVHRSALREAFGLLAHEGLLRSGERGGHFVPVLDRPDLDEILELRVILETGALRRLNRSEQPIDVSPLTEICRTMRQMIALKMPLGFAEADRKFHEQVIALSANPRISQAYQLAPVLIQIDGQMSESPQLSAMDVTTTEHETVCDALTQGDFVLAAERLEDHLLAAHSRHMVIQT